MQYEFTFYDYCIAYQLNTYVVRYFYLILSLNLWLGKDKYCQHRYTTYMLIDSFYTLGVF